MIQVDDCYYLGYVKKTNGVKGAVEVNLDVDDPAKYKKKESMLLLLKNNLTPFFIEQFTIRTNTILVKFKGIDTANDSEPLVGTSIYMPLTELPPLKGKNKFYFHEVIGYKVIDKTHGDIGIIKDIVELTSQNVIQIMKGDREILVPMVDEFIVEVNKETKEFTLNTPEGLIEMYLNN